MSNFHGFWGQQTNAPVSERLLHATWCSELDLSSQEAWRAPPRPQFGHSASVFFERRGWGDGEDMGRGVRERILQEFLDLGALSTETTTHLDFLWTILRS